MDYLQAHSKLNRHAGSAMSDRGRAEDSFHAGRKAGFVGTALQDSRFDAGIGDALLDIVDEHVGDQFGAAEDGTGAAEGEVMRQVAVGVDSGGDDDVELGLRGDFRDPWNVATQAEDCEVDNGIHAVRFQLIHAGGCFLDALVFIAPLFRVVLKDFRIQHKNVFMHQRGTQVRGIDRAAGGLNGGHRPIISRRC